MDKPNTPEYDNPSEMTEERLRRIELGEEVRDTLKDVLDGRQMEELEAMLYRIVIGSRECVSELHYINVSEERINKLTEEDGRT